MIAETLGEGTIMIAETLGEGTIMIAETLGERQVLSCPTHLMHRTLCCCFAKIGAGVGAVNGLTNSPCRASRR
jgi:hypothetical protein